MDSITDSMDISLSKLCETVEDGVAWHAVVHRIRVRHDLATEQDNNNLIISAFSSDVVFKANQKNTFFFFHDYPNHTDCDIASNGNIEN